MYRESCTSPTRSRQDHHGGQAERKDEPVHLQRSRNSGYNIAYHLVWCVKYRRPALTGKAVDRLKEILRQVAADNGFTIEGVEVMPDHVRLFVRATPNHVVAGMVERLKGVSARILFNEFPELKKELWGGHLWNPSYYAGTVGHISEEAVRKYIESQKPRGIQPLGKLAQGSGCGWRKCWQRARRRQS